MPVQTYHTAPVENIAPGVTRRLVYTPHLMTVILDFSNGPQTEPDPFHAHPHEQTCYVASGEVLFMAEGEEPAHLRAGDVFYVPANQKHCIQLLTEQARLVDSFTPIRTDFLKN
ncbi:cupin domain-containing protein [Adhaeribacter swui]|uniref:Cupin domain-containing protein n=1 Tax=Adhaeribacter swui TaxID=2086471 RepID=A0A7G7G967_9BACT|nr:cupin domain-containing protein [Adhaeribacter swui]QNF33701.1 cupin domain-containing protein [Adhaeribacter swui]